MIASLFCVMIVGMNNENFIPFGKKKEDCIESKQWKLKYHSWFKYYCALHEWKLLDLTCMVVLICVFYVHDIFFKYKNKY